jgi:hypothetical protein
VIFQAGSRYFWVFGVALELSAVVLGLRDEFEDVADYGVIALLLQTEDQVSAVK